MTLRQQLQAAMDLVLKRLGEKAAPAEIIAELVRDHGATYDPRGDAARLRCAGVASSCTWSRDVGLLDNWRRTAMNRLMVEVA
jgi:hypothetical protein